MRQVIEEMAAGRFAGSRPKLNTEDACISVRMGRNTVYEGSLTLEVSEGRTIKGMVHSSSPRVKVKEPAVSGTHVQLGYSINSTGLDFGEELNGSLLLVTDGGEYEIPFFVKVVRAGSHSSMGNVKNLFHFTNLAYTDYEEAYRIFCSKEFVQIFAEGDEHARMVYECLCRTGLSKAAMEEFLTGIRKKKRVALRQSNASLEVKELKEPAEGSIYLEKEGWGYVEAAVSADAPFVRLSRSSFTSEDFVGRYYEYKFLLDPGKMHGGVNYARIRIHTKDQEFAFEVTARQAVSAEGEERRRHRREHKEGRMRLQKLWLARRTGQMEESAWRGEARACLEALDPALEGGKSRRWEEFCALAGLYLLQEEGADDGQIGRRLSRIPRSPGWTKDTLLYCAYYFLASRIPRQTPEFLYQACDNLYAAWKREPEEWRVLFLLLALPWYRRKGAGEILEDISRQLELGCTSPLIYMEGFFLYRDNPELLKKLSKEDVRLFLWAAGQELVGEALADQIGQLAQQLREYDRAALRLLKLLYGRYPLDSILAAILGCLMRGGFVGKEYFSWYSLGVEKDLRITGLYEHYLYTVDERARKRLPMQLVLYFQYNSQLDYKKKAFLYANLYQYRKSYGSVYRQYEPQIEKFVSEQLMEGHMDRNLAKLYAGFLQEDMLTKTLAAALTKLLFLHRVYCRKPGMKRVTAVHKYMDGWQSVPVTDQVANVNIYMDDCALVFQNEEGEVFLCPDEYESRPYLPIDRFLPVCAKFFPDDEGIIFYQCGNISNYSAITQENVGTFKKLVNMDGVQEAFRERVREDILRYYYDNYEVDSLDEELFEINPESLPSAERMRLVEIYIARRMYERAYELIRIYGYEKFSAKRLVRLCIRMIRAREFEKDDFLLSLCYYTFSRHKYDETVLEYLCDYYNGSCAQMTQVCEAARNFHVDCYYLEERYLIQRLYIGCTDMEDFPVFQEYMHQAGSELLERAYITYHSHQYFLDREKGGRELFSWLSGRYVESGLHNVVCKLALLKYFARTPESMFRQEQMVQGLLDELACTDYRFAFYQEFPSAFLEPYFLEDKYFVEYRTMPGRNVQLHYQLREAGRPEGSWVSERMPEAYDGIYVREFTLFYRDRLAYYVTETEDNGDEVRGEKTEAVQDSVFLSCKKDRYHMINDMLICWDLSDSLTYRELEEDYQLQEAMAQAFFPLEKSAEAGEPLGPDAGPSREAGEENGPDAKEI